MNHREEWEKELHDLPLGSGGFSPDTAQKVKDRVAAGGYRKRRRQLAAAIAVSTVLLLMGASFWLNPSAQEKTAYEQVPSDEQKEVKLKVQFWDTRSFLSQVGYPYMKKYPNTSFKVAVSPKSGDIGSYIQWVRKQNPDVLQIPLEYIDDLANEGIILPLDDWAERDREQLGRLHQPVIDVIREAGNGKLYALANQFSVDALVYNKKLFKEKGIAPPKDNMTWEEVLQLASKFAGGRKDGKPVYGLSVGWSLNPMQAIEEVGLGEGLPLIGPDGRPSLNTPSWQEVWKKVIEGIRDGSIGNEGMNRDTGGWNNDQIVKADPFLQDRAAMSILGSGGWRPLQQAVITGASEGDWAAVSLPSGKSSSGMVRQFHLPIMYAVNANSSNPEHAWKLLRYLMGEEWAARMMPDNRTLYTVPIYTLRPGKSSITPEWIDAYYRAAPDVAAIVESAEYSQLPEYKAVIRTWQKYGVSLSGEALNGTITIEQALAEFQREAEKAVSALTGQEK